MPPRIDLDSITRIIREVAAEIIMPRFRKLAAEDVEMKGTDDPVTIADREAERALTKRLVAALPGSVVIGEESHALDKSIMSRLGGEAPVWIVDPIDGTRNFVAGKPEFAVMVALVVAGQPVAGWIHDPNSGDTLTAEQGGGTWLRGQQLHLATRDMQAPPVFLVGSRIWNVLREADTLLRGADDPILEIGSCAGFDYARLFAGAEPFAGATTNRIGYLIYRHTKVWDHAPGFLMHREAGGYAADWQGHPYDMAQPRNGLLYAPDRESWERLHGKLNVLMKPPLEAAS